MSLFLYVLIYTCMLSFFEDRAYIGFFFVLYIFTLSLLHMTECVVSWGPRVDQVYG